jgi:hypothetical protein
MQRLLRTWRFLARFPCTKKQAWCAFIAEVLVLLSCAGWAAWMVWYARTHPPATYTIRQLTPEEVKTLDQLLQKWEREGRDRAR